MRKTLHPHLSFITFTCLVIIYSKYFLFIFSYRLYIKLPINSTMVVAYHICIFSLYFVLSPIHSDPKIFVMVLELFMYCTPNICFMSLLLSFSLSTMYEARENFCNCSSYTYLIFLKWSAKGNVFINYF